MKTAFQKKAYSILTALVLLLTACTGAVFSSSAVVIRKEDRKRLEENTVAKREDSVHLLDKH